MLSNDFNYNHDEVKTNIIRFEKMLANNQNEYFDLIVLEQIIEYYLTENKIEKAFAACNLALEAYPFSLEVSLQKAQILANFAKFNEALSLLEDLSLMYPSDKDINFLKGNILLLNENFADAIEIFEDLKTIYTEKEDVLMRLGEAHQKLGKYEMAAPCYLEALSINDQNQEIYNELIFCYFITDQLDDKLDLFKEMIDNNPYSAIAWYNLGLANSKLGEWKDATEAFDFAIVIKPDYADAYFNRGNAFMNSEVYPSAQVCYKKAIEHGLNTADMHCHLGASFEDDEKYLEAITYYKKAIELDENWHEGYFGIASSLSGLERYIEAIHFSKKAIKLSPKNSYYWLELAENEGKLGNEISANEAYQKAVELDSFNVDAYNCWSMYYYGNEQYERAIEIMEMGLEDQPDIAEFYYRIAIYMIADKKLKEAITYLEVALNLDYDGHTILFEFFTDLAVQKSIFKIVQQYKSK
jgi:tetratricopeptide (TPR) repeat protein